ncbi:Crp/Fnr family transcriptional regulator [Chryseobacterium sp. PTM-20240506]|uniref:Crp/Fnr family transcriptional regulator n=1 Tax=Chryseobacterium sp. PTM-20240506 TaxID=3400631 RepID=UPI003AAD380D
MINEDLLLSYGAEVKNYKSGDTIFREGELALHYYQIIKGKIKLNNYTEDGKEFIQNIFSDGNSFGESILFVDKPYPMNAESLTPSTVLKLSKSDFLILMKENPEVSNNIYQCMAERMYYKYVMLYNLSVKIPLPN